MKPPQKVHRTSLYILRHVPAWTTSSKCVFSPFLTCFGFRIYIPKVLPSLSHRQATFYSLHGNLSPTARTRTLGAFASAVPSPSSPSILLATDVAARGLDLPNVDVVIQFDPPTDTKTFSHRCGRTARAGKSGTAWVLLSDREVEFVDFLSIRKIPLKQKPYLLGNGEKFSQQLDDARPVDPDVDLFLNQTRKVLQTDRAIHDQSMKAFVSFVRAYSKHEASYIFRIKDLDLVGVAKSFGLLRLPKMPEMKTVNRDSWQDAEISWDDFKYADQAQEAKRVAAAAEAKEEAKLEKERRQLEHVEKKKKNAAWSEKLGKRQEKEKRRGKRISKKNWLKSQEVVPAMGSERLLGKRQRNGSNEDMDAPDDNDDWAELAHEEKMAKRLRKGDISQKDFDTEFGGL